MNFPNNELTQIQSIDQQTLQNIMSRNKRSERKSQFKNPPQPRFCIKEQNIDGRTVFINILSYNKIANQQSEFDPIPLYGAMQIRPVDRSIRNASNLQQPENLPIIFAVMAAPEILKKTGRNYADSPEQMNLVELMCEFVEAMNPGVVLSKKPEILKDRDLTGELKEIWSSVQNFRDKEKANMSDIVVYTDFGPETMQPNQNEPANNSLDKAAEAEAANSTEKSDSSTTEQAVSSEKKHDSIDDSIEVKNIDIESLTIGDKKAAAKQGGEENREEIVKLQNQKNKSNFFPKFLSSSKDNSTKAAKDSKKSLNFFRRNKSTSSPTHTPSDNQTNNLKIDSDD